jgi:membrane-associated phospholipid phosphatase
MGRLLSSVTLVLFVGFSAQMTLAASPQRHYDLENTTKEALLVETLGASAGLAGAWLLTGGPRKDCRWCTANVFDESVRSTLKADEPRAPALISHGLSVVAVPTLTLTGLIVPAYRDGQTMRGLEDSWIVVNTFLLTTAVGDFTKHVIARQRPTFHHKTDQNTEFSTYPMERNKSFFSLDTAWAFAIVSSGATLARLHGYSSATPIALGGGALAIAAGTLRVVGDAHWATDVLTGAAVGTLIGITVPILLHGRKPREDVSGAQLPTTRTTTLSMQFSF